MHEDVKCLSNVFNRTIKDILEDDEGDEGNQTKVRVEVRGRD